MLGYLLESLTRSAKNDADKGVMNALREESSRVRPAVVKPETSEVLEEGARIGSERGKPLQDLKEELSVARKRFLELEQKVTNLSEQRDRSAAHRTDRERVVSLERKLEVAAAQQKAMMEELRENATDWAKEKARYELEIAGLRRSGSRSHQTAGTVGEISARVRNSSSNSSLLSSITPASNSRQQRSSTISQSVATPHTTPRTTVGLESVPTPVPTAQHRSLPGSSNPHPLHASVRSRTVSNHSQN